MSDNAQQERLIDAAELVQLSNDKFNKAKEMKKTWLTSHDENWRLYRNDYTADNSRKAEWQARGYIPYLTDMIDREVGAILEGYVNTKRTLYEATTGRRIVAAAMRDLLLEELELNCFDRILDECVLEAILSGYSIVKHRWNDERGFMELRTVDPLDFYRLPDGSDGFLTIEAITIERGDLEGFKEAPEYDAKAIDDAIATKVTGQVAADRADIELRKREQQNLGRERFVGLQDPVTLYEFWGRLYNAQGERLGTPGKDEFFNWVLCNDQLIKPPEASYFWQPQMTPYSFGYIKRVQNDPYPNSVVCDHVVLQRSHTRLINLIADKVYKHRTQWVAKKGHIAKRDIELGISDHRVIQDNLPGPPGLQAITPNMTLEPEFQLLATVERGMHLMGMTATQMGQPTLRSAQTLGEVQMQMAASSRFLSTIARRIEGTLLRDVVRHTIVFILQFKLDNEHGSNPYYSRNVMDFLVDNPEGLAGLSGNDELRRSLLERDFAEIRIRGLGDLLSKQEKAVGLNYFLRMYTQLLQTATAMAQVDPQLAAQAKEIVHMVNFAGLVYESAEMTGFSPERVLTPEARELVERADAGRKREPPDRQAEIPKMGVVNATPRLAPGTTGTEGVMMQTVPMEAERSLYD